GDAVQVSAGVVETPAAPFAGACSAKLPGGPHTEDVRNVETSDGVVARAGQYGSPFPTTRQKYVVAGRSAAVWNEVDARSVATTRAGGFTVSRRTSYRNVPGAAVQTNVTES